MEKSRDKHLGLTPGKPPQFFGAWTNGEARAVLMAALQWLDSLPLTMPEREQEQDKEVDDGG